MRPRGDGADSLLLTAGQLDRRSRTWWRLVLDEMGAADLLMPIARLERQYPGGPVRGTFSARHGPDNRFLGSFTLTANDEAGVPAMLAKAVQQLDQLYSEALATGRLSPDKTLFVEQTVDDKLIAEIIAREDKTGATDEGADNAGPNPKPTTAATATSFTVQFATPDPAAVDAALSSVRAVQGVQGVTVSSVAVGGTSVMRVSYTGDMGALAAALRGRGWQVSQGKNALSIRK